jgi:Tannase and feruloyl esterase
MKTSRHLHACLALALALLVTRTYAQPVSPPASPSAASCAALGKLTLPNTRVVLAEEIAAGTLPSPNPLHPEPFKLRAQLPALCRVLAIVSPSADSEIRMEVWMPSAGWNGKFRGVGNGGFAGEIDYNGLAESVAQGYAVGGTDTGHEADGIDAAWALGHPEKVIDYGHRGIHEMTLKSKSIVEAYYGSAAKRAYFASCSDGGREALMEAQRYPADYDGIIAGAPANNWTHLLTNAVFNTQALMLNPASYIPPSKLHAIASGALAACDAADGVTDGILNDPRQCRFDPAVLLCKGPENDQCLTAPQVTALKALYDGAHDSAGHQVFPGYLPGAEEGEGGWAPWITGSAPGTSAMFAFGQHYFTNMVYAKADWDWKTFNVDDALKLAMEKSSQALDATDPDLKPFGARGGKLILWHGWNDPAISSLSTIDYYGKMLQATGPANAQTFVRLYMAPGVQHCSGGPGPDSFGQYGWFPGMGPDDPQHDMFLSLEQWVERGTAPQDLVATKYAGEGAARHAVMARPLCAYPRVATYKGSGDSNLAANFSCVAGAK